MLVPGIAPIQSVREFPNQKHRHLFPMLVRSLCFYNIETMNSREIIVALGALAQESRLALYRLLVRRGPEGLAPGDLCEKLGVPAPTLSFHLKTLTHAGLIEQRREGRFLYYSACYSRMNELLAFLTDNCCGESDAFKAPRCTPATPGTVASKRRQVR